jgi:hypothetical protein
LGVGVSVCVKQGESQRNLGEDEARGTLRARALADRSIFPCLGDFDHILWFLFFFLIVRLHFPIHFDHTRARLMYTTIVQISNQIDPNQPIQPTPRSHLNRNRLIYPSALNPHRSIHTCVDRPSRLPLRSTRARAHRSLPSRGPAAWGGRPASRAPWNAPLPWTYMKKTGQDELEKKRNDNASKWLRIFERGGGGGETHTHPYTHTHTHIYIHTYIYTYTHRHRHIPQSQKHPTIPKTQHVPGDGGALHQVIDVEAPVFGAGEDVGVGVVEAGLHGVGRVRVPAVHACMHAMCVLTKGVVRGRRV